MLELFGNLVNEWLPSLKKEDRDIPDRHGAHGHTGVPDVITHMLSMSLFPEVDAMLDFYYVISVDIFSILNSCYDVISFVH